MGDNAAEHPWLLSLSLAKRWSEDFSKAVPIQQDNAFVDELKQFNPGREGVELFMEPYGQNLSIEIEAVIQFCHGVLVTNLHSQDKGGSAWLDDRSYASYFDESALLLDSSSMPSVPQPETTSIAQGIARALSDEFLSHSSDGHIPSGVARILQTTGQAHQRRYTPRSRRYAAPLTATMLYHHLSKKVRAFDITFGEKCREAVQLIRWAYPNIASFHFIRKFTSDCRSSATMIQISLIQTGA